jgi:hypothetical protein
MVVANNTEINLWLHKYEAFAMSRSRIGRVAGGVRSGHGRVRLTGLHRKRASMARQATNGMASSGLIEGSRDQALQAVFRSVSAPTQHLNKEQIAKQVDSLIERRNHNFTSTLKKNNAGACSVIAIAFCVAAIIMAINGRHLAADLCFSGVVIAILGAMFAHKYLTRVEPGGESLRDVRKKGRRAESQPSEPTFAQYSSEEVLAFNRHKRKVG